MNKVKSEKSKNLISQKNQVYKICLEILISNIFNLQ